MRKCFTTLVSLLIAILTLLQISPIHAIASKASNTSTFFRAKSVQIGDTVLLAENDAQFALTCNVTSYGMSTQRVQGNSNKIQFSKSDTHLLWTYTENSLLYNEILDAYLSRVDNLLLLTRESNNALQVTFSENGTAIFTNNNDVAMLTFDADTMCFGFSPRNALCNLSAYVSSDIAREINTKSCQINVSETASAPTESPITNLPTTSPIIAVEYVEVMPAVLSVHIGETAVVSAHVYPDNATTDSVIWGSNNTAVATVENGSVTGISNGAAVISATSVDGGKVAFCTVTVSAYMHTVTFFDKGSTQLSQTEVVHGMAAIAPTPPTHEGYSFVEWDTDFSCVLEDLQVYSKWQAADYTITYNLNGGSFVTIPMSAYTVETATFALPAPQRNGYTFNGWYATVEFAGEKITQITHGSTGDKVFYAKWQAADYTITYNLNGGSFVTIPTATYTIESPKIILPIPQRAGYKFSGWYDNAKLDGAESLCIPAGSTGNKIFYAKWQAIVYQITYELNGGNGMIGALTSYTIESPVIYLPMPTRRGFSFVGWYDNSALMGERSTKISTGSIGDKTFYAAWDYVQYTITYQLNGGTNPITAPSGYNIDSDILTMPVPQRSGYSFAGWYLNADLTGAAKVSIPRGSIGNLTLYAAWNVITYSINYTLNGGTNPSGAPKTFTIESSETTLPVPTRVGYDFAGWYDNPECIGNTIVTIVAGSVGNRALYAKWRAVVYTIKYVVNGGIQSPAFVTSYTVESTPIKLIPTTKRGYTFEGWYDNSSQQGNPIEVIQKGSVGNRTYYAAWNVVTYSINYTLNGGTNPSGAPKTFTIESSETTLPVPMRVGYDFVGWYDNPECIGNTIVTIVAGSVGNRTLYAKWRAVVYTIKYVVNGGSLTTTYIEKYTIETNLFYLPIPERTGYDFGGWYDSVSFAGNAMYGIPKGTTGNLVLYARWTPTIFKIIYNVYNGLMPSEYATQYTIESDVVVLPRPTMVGHVFVGWYENADFSGVPIREIESGSVGNKTYYANWRRLVYTVTFLDWDNETLIGTVRAEYGAIIAQPPTPPEHYGYTFKQWSEDLSFISSNMTVVAQYELNTYDVVFVDIDYFVISKQAVKHGQSASAPTPPQHEGSVFVFWSCDYTCIVSDLVVVAIYRATAVIQHGSGGRYVKSDELVPGESYIFVANDNGLTALSVLDRFDGCGLWGLDIVIDTRSVRTVNPSGNIDDAIFVIEGAQTNGYTLSNVATNKKVVCSQGYLTMSENPDNSGDRFMYVKRDGAFYLYNMTGNTYLHLNSDGYFEPSNISEATHITAYKEITITAEYTKVNVPTLGKNYCAVALTEFGAYALSANESKDELIGVPVEVVDGKMYFMDNMDEREIAFRFAFGNNTKGFLLRSVAVGKYLASKGGLNTTDNPDKAGLWVYTDSDNTQKHALLDYISNSYLHCGENGDFSAVDSETCSQIMLFERVPTGGRMGDVNMDSIINTGDAVLLLRHAVGNTVLNSNVLRISDANHDGAVNTGDASLLLRFVVGLVDWIG